MGKIVVGIADIKVSNNPEDTLPDRRTIFWILYGKEKGHFG